MIGNIFKLLTMSDHYGQSELIEIAKGKYKLETSIKGKFKQGKRIGAWQSKKQKDRDKRILKGGQRR